MSSCYLDRDCCPICGLAYKSFRCSLQTFSEAKAQLYKAGESDSSKWRQKRRHSVLGYWHGIKKSEWEYHLRGCGGYSSFGIHDARAFACY